MIQWIEGTSKAFNHTTHILDQVSEENKIIIRIRMELEHIGSWRGIPPTHKKISTYGFRYYQLSGDKIMEHWALIDGQAIENQLKEIQGACKISKD